MRESGILCHITSLPSPYGIGDLGPQAYAFADFLVETGQGYWQILPVNPVSTAKVDSPYAPISAFGGNTALISPELLAEDGLLSPGDMITPSLPGAEVDYQGVQAYKGRLLQTVYENFKRREKEDPDFERFREEHACWLDDYSLFAVLYQRSGKKHLSQWPADTRDRDDGKLRALKIGLGDHIRREKFLQFVFHKQWIALKEYCNARGVKIIGDIPLYVDYDSADVWVHPEIFKVNEHRRPLVLAGSPPDFFSEKGQLYESPAYNWDAVRSTHYSWWIRRVKHNLKLYDKVRLDQLRGYVKAWEVPYGEESAVNGQWVDVPAYGFFNALYRHIASFPLIAEDLGAVAAETREVMHTYDFPGINVLVFAFGADMPRSSYILHNHARNSVVYTGTHDTNTVAGWFDGADDAEKGRFLEYTGRKDGSDVHWDMIRLAMMSVADTAVIPMQDLLGLGAEARMNNPASPRGNWKWRFLSGQLTRAIKDRLSEMTAIYGRKQ